LNGEESLRERLEHRVASLRAEYDSGQRALAELEQKQATLRDTVLRISGAIQVLEEELAQATAAIPSGSP
jgi:chromosome segregation ATPase